MGRKVLDRKPRVSPEVGCCGKATTRLAPNGYVRVEGELWQASSIGSEVNEGEDIIVVGVRRLVLFVKINREDGLSGPDIGAGWWLPH